MKAHKYALLTAGLSLAMAFTLFACSSDDGNENPSTTSSSSVDVEISSSSGTAVSLCAGEEYDPDVFRCEAGELIGKCRGVDYFYAYQTCNDGVIIERNPSSSSISPNSSSSSDLGVSSSNDEGSSSSVALSSSVMPSSSSVVPSSSSTTCTPSGNDNTHYCSNGVLKEYGFVDGIGQTYKTVVIGSQTWMAENLNYNVNGSFCNDELPLNCFRYGRLYDWATAMGISSTYNNSSYNPVSSTKYQGICPYGWHIPNNSEWTTLINFIGGDLAGEHLMATYGWDNDNNGIDTYGFEARPGGAWNEYSDGNGFFGVGWISLWWSASEENNSEAYQMSNSRSTHGYCSADTYPQTKSQLMSVRCLKD